MDTPEQSRPRFVMRPFRALRLANSFVGDPSANRIFARPYRAVPSRLRDWRRKKHLLLDDVPAMYVHEYTSAGVTIRGLVGLLDLAESSESVFAHEAVQEQQTAQLADRMHQMQLNPAPILLMHRGPERVRALVHGITAGEPQLVYTDRGDQLQRLWRVTDQPVLELLSAQLEASRTVIADGHHRYAAAQDLHAAAPGSGWGSTLAMLVDQSDTPLQLCAIHRTIPRVSLERIASTCGPGDLFRWCSSSHQALAKLGDELVLHDGKRWATLRPASTPEVMVAWLHQDLLPRWSVDPTGIVFHHSATEAITRAGMGVSVLLPAPRFDDVERSARSGQLLPQKATSFQPKPHPGVIMRDLSAE